MRTVLEYPMRGETYHEDKWGAYGYDVYPKGSVLAGQDRRMFLASFDTFQEAARAYPRATVVRHD